MKKADDIVESLKQLIPEATQGKWISPWDEDLASHDDCFDTLHNDKGEKIVEASYYDGCNLGILQENANYITTACPENIKILIRGYQLMKFRLERLKK